MLPEGCYIVFIHKALFQPQMQVPEPNLLWIGAEPETTLAGDAVCLAMNEKAVQMGVIPAHDDLENAM